MEQRSADWWTSVLQTPVQEADGTFINPDFDESAVHSQMSSDGQVLNLFGSFFPGTHPTRSATVPANTPVFVPILDIEFSNADTAAPDGTFPGHRWPAPRPPRCGTSPPTCSRTAVRSPRRDCRLRKISTGGRGSVGALALPP